MIQNSLDNRMFDEKILLLRILLTYAITWFILHVCDILISVYVTSVV